MMYEDLVKDLRFCASSECSCVECTHNMEICCENMLLEQSANAIEELQKERNVWKATAEDWRDAYHHWFENYQKDAQKWVPVTKRSPIKDGWYLVCGKTRNGFEMWVCEYTTIAGLVRGWSNQMLNMPVAYWMPLPEPPKEEME